MSSKRVICLIDVIIIMALMVGLVSNAVATEAVNTATETATNDHWVNARADQKTNGDIKHSVDLSKELQLCSSCTCNPPCKEGWYCCPTANGQCGCFPFQCP